MQHKLRKFHQDKPWRVSQLVTKQRSKIHHFEKWIYGHFTIWNSSRRQIAQITVQKTTTFEKKSGWEHVQVAVCKIVRFSCPERFWPRQASKFREFWAENWSDARKMQEMNVFKCNSLPWSDQNDAQKQLKNAKSAKIRENPRSVSYENAWKFAFWARQGNTLQKVWIFMSGALLTTSR